MKLKDVRLSKGIKAKELGIKVGTDEAMMSRFENYKCLPTPPTMEKICKELGCEVLDLYDRNEVVYDSVVKTALESSTDEKRAKRNEKKRSKNVYHLTVELPPEARDFFKYHLEEMGYKDITDWANQMFSRLVFDYDTKKNDITHAAKQ